MTGPMTPEQAAWVRENAWLPSMLRRPYFMPGGGTTRDHALAAAVCPCMAGTCYHCATDRHEFCHRRMIRPEPECWITNRPLDYIKPTAVWYADRACRSLCPCGCPRQMAKGEAAWVRQNAWTKAMAAALAPTDTCPCLYGPSTACAQDACGQCKHDRPVLFAEAHITDKSGSVLHAPGFRGGHPAVWLADRVCRWVCGCACHTAPEPQAEQLDLFAEVAA